jgi:hypothetical protein
MTQRLRSDRRVLSVAITLLIAVLAGGVLLVATRPTPAAAVVAAVVPSQVC